MLHTGEAVGHYQMQSSPTASPLAYILRQRTMDYVEKLNRMDRHLAEHPHDYQTVISRMKTASAAHDYQQKQKVNIRLKRVAEIRRQLREIKNGKE